MVAVRFAVSVFVIVCTTTGAPPPIWTPPTVTCRSEAMPPVYEPPCAPAQTGGGPSPGRAGRQVWYVRVPLIRLPLRRSTLILTLNLPFGRPRSRTGAVSRLPRTTLTRLPLTRTVAERAFFPCGTRMRIRNDRRETQLRWP